MKIKMKRIMGFFLALVMVMGFLPLNPIASYANDDVNSDVKIKIDETHFPDPKFREYVKDKSIDKDGDGELSQVELDAVTDINVRSKSISTLRGIKYFKNLESLDCVENKLTSLDVSNNTKLTKLDCSLNELTELNVSKNTNLTKLYYANNNLPSLNVSNNKKLTELDCSINKVTSLDISENTNLSKLNCSDNELKELNVRNNTELSELDCFSNELKELNVSNNKKLTRLWCESNKLTELNVSNNKELGQLHCSYNKLTELKVTKDAELNDLDCSDNKLTELNVSNNKELTKLQCKRNVLKSLDVSNNTKLTELDCDENKLTELNVSNNKELGQLHCSYNKLTELNVSNNKELYELYGLGNKLTSMDLSQFMGHYVGFDYQKYDITVDKNTRKFEYSKFPGRFDKAKVTSLVGATLGDDGLIVNSNTPSEITYNYKVNGREKMQVKLNVTYKEFDSTHVKGMSVKTQPKLSYTAGEKLDLSGLVVTLTDNQGGKKDVTPAEFGTFSITAEPENKAPLTLANDGKPVKLSKKGVQDAVTKNLTVKAASASAGAEYIAESEAADATTTLYRLYNKWTHEHLFTTDKNEYDMLVAAGWTAEGSAGKVAIKQGKGVYRLYNPTTGEHHYTTKEDEVAACVKVGWVNEGIHFYSVQNGDVPVYSMYNPYEKKFYHHYTSDPDEIARMVKAGWINEGIKWYEAK